MTLYTVQPGDCLWDLSQRFYKTPLLWPQLFAYNNRKEAVEKTGTVIFDPDMILIGQLLVIPSKDKLLGNADKIKKKIREQRAEHIRRSSRNFHQINQMRQSQPQPNSGEAMGRRPALYAAEPGWEYDLSETKFPEVQTPKYSVKLSMKGKIKLINSQTSSAKFTVQGVKQVEVKSEHTTKTEYGNLVSDVKVSNFDPIKRKATFSCGLTAKSNIPNAPEVELSPQVNERGQPSLKGSVKFQMVKGKINAHTFASEEIEVTLEFAIQSTTPTEETGNIWSDVADFASGAAIIIGAAGLSVGTILEDLYPVLGGPANDAISFIVVAGMVAKGAQMISKAAPGVIRAGAWPARKAFETVSKYGSEALIFLGLMSAPPTIRADEEPISSDD